MLFRSLDDAAGQRGGSDTKALAQPEPPRVAGQTELLIQRAELLFQLSHVVAGAPRPRFLPLAVDQGQAKIGGILGMELLAASHGIIDFDSMSLFLK